MELKQYITEQEKQYHLRLKTIVPLDDALMDRIEQCVAKYDPHSVSRPNKTILQRAPLDFPNVTAAEVYIVDMTFGLPAAPHVLRADIRKVLDAPENYVFVRNQNEPGERETRMLNALADMDVEAERRGLRPASVLLDPNYDEASATDVDLFGTDYNDALLKYLGTVEGERRAAQARVESAPFRWLPVDRQDNFNDDVKDAPFVTHKPQSKPEVGHNMLGNLDNTRGEIRRAFIDSNGNRVVLTRKLEQY